MTDPITKTLCGEWEVIACHIGGTPNDANVGCRISIDDRHIHDHHQPQTIVYEYTIDDSHTPQRMTWKMLGVEKDGAIQPLPMAVPPATGVYELAGDELHFCWSNPGRPFPADFQTGRDSNCHSYTYRRLQSQDGG